MLSTNKILHVNLSSRGWLSFFWYDIVIFDRYDIYFSATLAGIKTGFCQKLWKGREASLTVKEDAWWCTFLQ